MIKTFVKIALNLSFIVILKVFRYYSNIFFKRLDLVRLICGFEFINRLLLICSGSTAQTVLKHFGAKIGSNVRINTPLILHNVEHNYNNLIIGDNCHIGKDIILDLKEQIKVDDNVTISMRVSIITHTDVGDSPLKQNSYPARQKGVIIHSGVYVGAGAIILHGITIGENTVLGAGAVVTRDVPPYTVAVGLPAKVVKNIKPGIDVQN